MGSRLISFRQHKDEYFARGENSPIDEADLGSFTALDYFDENPDLAFQLEIDAEAPGPHEHIILGASDGETAEFARAGMISFSVGDKEAQLTLLKDLERGRFFLPFADATTGTETY